MGANSVTGVGLGSAEKSGLKGPSNGRNMFVPQICPHVVMAGIVETVNEDGDVYSGTVTFPQGPLPLGKDSYIVMVTPVVDSDIGSAPTEVWYVTRTETDGQMVSFTVTTTWTALQVRATVPTFMYEVVTAGMGLDIVKDNPNTP